MTGRYPQASPHPPAGNDRAASVDCCAVILAAGESTRFGSDKRRFRLADGRTMLETTLAAYQGVFEDVFVVLKPADESWASPLGRVQPVYAKDSVLGMGHSLAAGVGAGRHFDFLFVALADMPEVRATTLERLKNATAGPASIVQPVYRGTPGHPAGFGRAHFSELERLTGDAGARRVIREHGDSTLHIDVDDPGVLQDYDFAP